MKIISWNVNGIRAINKKGFVENIKKINPDIVLMQEVKASHAISKNNQLSMPGYKDYWHNAKKSGYSGVGIYTSTNCHNIIYGIQDEEFDSEGRLIALEMDKFYIVNVYLPHSGRKLEKIDKKIKFNDKFLQFVKKLENKKPVIIGGDFNVAHKEIDLARPKENANNAGFTSIERKWFDDFLSNHSFLDTFRIFNQQKDHYTWWSYMFHARERNIGWRIDYFIVSKKIRSMIKKSSILNQYLGSDHCPVVIDVNV
jgi:exodeoxyribonuclease-3